MFFFVFDFLQKTNENKSIWGIIVVKMNSFVRFLEEIEGSKNHFEIIWPLPKTAPHSPDSDSSEMSGTLSRIQLSYCSISKSMPSDGRAAMLETFPVFLPITHLLVRELEPEKKYKLIRFSLISLLTVELSTKDSEMRYCKTMLKDRSNLLSCIKGQLIL